MEIKEKTPSYIKEFDTLFKEYKTIKFAISQQEQDDDIATYVQYSNSLEGNRLNLIQTTKLLQNNIISGNNIRFFDILETKGHAKALNFVINTAVNK